MSSARRILSILFLFLMLLNIIGYYSFLVVVRNQVARSVVEKIQTAANEPGGNLIVKLPLSLPYGSDSETYQAIQGEVSFEGSVYQFVKQRVYQDTLYVVCIQDSKTTDVNDKMTDYTRSFTGENKQQRTNGITLIDVAAKYYSLAWQPIVASVSGWSRDQLFPEVSPEYIHHASSNIFHPPKLA